MLKICDKICFYYVIEDKLSIYLIYKFAGGSRDIISKRNKLF